MTLNFLMGRLLRLVLCVAIATTINFALPRLMPGNPVVAMLGQDAAALTKQDYADLMHEYGLDAPLPVQYVRYLSSLAEGELGFSFHYRQPVAELIRGHLTWTLLLLLPAVLVSSVLALFLGSLAGWRPGSAVDMFFTLGSVCMHAVPQFLLAMLFLGLFGFRLGWFPLGGCHSGTGGSGMSLAADVLWHLTLPFVVLVLSSTAMKLMVMRNAVAKAREEDYVVYAFAKGVHELRVLFVHILRNACLPLLNLVSLNLGFIVSGALLIEIVFSVNGMGTLIYQAAIHRDYPVLQACFLVLTLVVIGANTLIDLVCGIVDPRLRTHDSTV
ncbi:MAG: ABC transporter permease [Bacillota bacterium]